MEILRNYTSFFIFVMLVSLIVNLNNAESDFEDLRLIKECKGFVITKAGITQCTPYIVKTTTTKPLAPSTTKADIYLITDVSANVPAKIYASTLTDFLMEFFNNFKIDPKYVNVAFSPSPGDNDTWLTPPVFNEFYGSEVLRNSINSSYYPIMGEQSPGQKQLADVIGMAVNPIFLNTGYNPPYKPHWLIYVTTTSSSDFDAIAAAQKVRKSGKFKVVIIAYHPTGNIEALLRMSDCFYPAYQPRDLSGLATVLAAKIIFDNSIGQDGPC
uniref:VWFA domain-containing protein n=1 Tax=Strongyloides papillosus TaxID=174720 RepID=A0A0N5BQT5_STREA